MAVNAADAEALRQAARDIRMRLLVRVTAIHWMAGGAVFVYIQARYPASRALGTPWVNDIAVLVASQMVLFPVAWGWVSREFRSSAGWALAGRDPTPQERRSVLREPARMASRPLVLWAATALVFAAASEIQRNLEFVEVVDLLQIMASGGLAACIVSYPIIEQTYRRLFAAALPPTEAPEIRTLGVRPRIVLAWAAGSGLPLLGIAGSPLRATATSPVAIAILAIIGLIAGGFSVFAAANSVAKPLGAVRAAFERVAVGDLDADVLVDDAGAVGQVQAGFNRMLYGLRERRDLQDLFSRHVGAEVAAQALERGTDLGGEQREASAVFVDLIGSTAMAEVLPPGEVVATLNAFFDAVVDVVTDAGGWVNKFEGDGALCVFGVPGVQPDHAARALRAARLLRARLGSLTSLHPGLEAGIGVSTGVVVAGNVGSAERFEYTVIGRAVNQAARLTELAKERPTLVLAAGTTVAAAGAEAAHWRSAGTVGLRGQQQPTHVFELDPAALPSPAPTGSPS